MKKELVISAFEKDMSWISKINSDIKITIYRSGTKTSNPNEIFLEYKIGRDILPYFIHILNNYDNLADITFFSQDYPFDHIENYVEIINSDIDYITNEADLHFGGYYGFHWNSIGTMWQLHDSNQFQHSKVLTCNSIGNPHDTGLYLDEIWKLLFSCPQPENYDFIPGGHFCVTNETVKIRSKEFYQQIVNLLETYDKMPWIIERLEPYIFNKNYR
jgi:hypothetical protein